MTIDDVATHAGVSVTTVSRVLNSRGYISQKMYKKVYDAIAELDYHPNQLARNLFRKRTNLIGLVIPDVSHPFFSLLTRNLEYELYENGYKLLLCNTTKMSNRERDYLLMLRENKVDGIIMGSHTLETDEYQRIKLPIVSIDMLLGENIPTVSSDHVQGGRLAAEKLIANGCRKVVQIMGYGRVQTPSHDRHKAFSEVMARANVNCVTIELEEQEFSTEAYNAVAQRIFRDYGGVDGVFAVDLIAATILRTAHEKGINVPWDLKIVGYDGTDIVYLTYPVLTTVKQPYNDIAKSIIGLLHAMINNLPIEQTHVKLPVILEENGTTI